MDVGCNSLYSVDSLRLGYAAWDAENGDYTLMPVRVLEGEQFDSAKAEPRARVTEATPSPC